MVLPKYKTQVTLNKNYKISTHSVPSA